MLSKRNFPRKPRGLRVQVGSNGRGNGRVTTSTIRQRRKRRGKRSQLKQTSVTTIGAGYDVKVQNPGAEITGMRNDAVTVRGRVAIATWNARVITGVAQHTFFVPLNQSLATQNSYIMWMNPLNIFPSQSRDFNVAVGYAQFYFSQIKFILQSTTSTAINCSGVIAYTGDGAMTGSAFDSSSEILSFPNSISFPAWGSRTLDVTPSIIKNEWYYIDIGSTAGVSNDADYRQALQGAIGGYTNGFDPAEASDGFQFGTVYMEYTMHLRGARIAGDYALRNFNAKSDMKLREERARSRKLESLNLSKDLEDLALSRREQKEALRDLIDPIASSVIVEQPSPQLQVRGTPQRAGSKVEGKSSKAEK